MRQRACPGGESHAQVAEGWLGRGRYRSGLSCGELPVEGDRFLGCGAGLTMAAEAGEPDSQVGEARGQFREVPVGAGSREVSVNRGCFLGGGQGVGVAAETCQAEAEVGQRGRQLRGAGAWRAPGEARRTLTASSAGASASAERPRSDSKVARLVSELASSAW